VVLIHNGILISYKKNEILTFTGKWMELENIISSEVRLRRPKITCSPSYVDYIPKTNAEILLDMGHTLREEHAREEYGKGSTQKLECGCCAHCIRVNTVILNSQRPLWEDD
jgi:hypothetical protein